jgi:hypothetical protein
MLSRRNSVRFELLTAVSKKITLLEDVTSCGLSEGYRPFGEISVSVFQGGGSDFIRNDSTRLPEYTASHP